MDISAGQAGKRPLFIAGIAAYMIFVGLIRAGGEIVALRHGLIGSPSTVTLTVFYLFCGITLLSRRWWARRLALGLIMMSTLNFFMLGGHLVSLGARRYAIGLVWLLAFLLWNGLMFFLLTRPSAKAAFAPQPIFKH